MKKINIKIDEDVYNALVAFTVLNETESFDLSLAMIMFDATMSQSGAETYGILYTTSRTAIKKLLYKKIKQYVSVDADAEV